MKLLLDEGVPLRTAERLRELGVEARHVLELKMSGCPDESVLAKAREDGAVVVAFDSDFHRLLATAGATSPSVMRIRVEGLAFDKLADLLITVGRDASESLQAGAVVSVTARQIRIRKLPIEGPA